MTKKNLYKILKKRKTLERAFEQALADRTRRDPYSDPGELAYMIDRKDQIVKNLKKRLEDLNNYYPLTGYTYFQPKNRLVNRRMVYLPFEELVLHYAIVGVLGRKIDPKLSPRCFANRLEEGEEFQHRLLEDYAEKSWPKFVKWQEEASQKYSVLLRTDIVSFYDSISHKALSLRIADELEEPIDSKFMRLFAQSLQIPIVSYSHLNDRVVGSELHQGIPSGGTPQGALANFYLKNLDETMDSIEGIEFGRYNDDMRIFGPDEKSVRKALLILQEKLQELGLNLGAGKTEIATDCEEIDALRSKLLDVSGFLIVEEDEREPSKKRSEVEERIDRRFDQIDPEYSPGVISSDSEAKEFCRFLSHRSDDGDRVHPYGKRDSEDIARLVKIVTEYPGSGKHAAWLLVESMYKAGIQPEVKEYARKSVLALLESGDSVDVYSRIRILHHIVKRSWLMNTIRNELKPIAKKMLEESAFDANIMGMTVLFVLGTRPTKIRKYLKKRCHAADSGPIVLALDRLMLLSKK